MVASVSTMKGVNVHKYEQKKKKTCWINNNMEFDKYAETAKKEERQEQDSNLCGRSHMISSHTH